MAIRSFLGPLFRSLQGVWTFERSVNDQLSGALLSSVKGKAWFYPLLQRRGVFRGFSNEDDAAFGHEKITGFSSDESIEEAVASSQWPEEILHYREEGTWTNHMGKILTEQQEYFYRYQADKDAFATHFAKDGRLFYWLTFVNRDTLERVALNSLEESILIAEGDHQCVDDRYEATHRYHCEVDRDGYLGIRKMALKYKVSGPNKSYLAETEFQRSPGI